jgi:adenine specific DNA methylase Mod
LKEIFYSKTFDFPKPSELLKFIFTVSTDKKSIILDSFAGSGTTAHAVLNLNKQDGGNRKYILIEMEDYADTIIIDGSFSDLLKYSGHFFPNWFQEAIKKVNVKINA